MERPAPGGDRDPLNAVISLKMAWLTNSGPLPEGMNGYTSCRLLREAMQQTIRGKMV